MRRLLSALALAGALSLASAPAIAGADVRASVRSATTVVTFTFDDGWKGQEQAASSLISAGLHGTFYVNSGQIGYPAYMGLDTLKLLEVQGHEIAGKTVSGTNLTQLTPAEAKAEVCNDRATLSHLGFRVTNFAYPQGAVTNRVKAIVRACGYDSARASSGLRAATVAEGCGECPYANTIPPRDIMRIRVRADARTPTLAGLKAQVMSVERHGGGWLPLAFTHVTNDPTVPDRISLADFDAFAVWVSQRPKTTQVYTMDQVIGGDVRPVTGTVLNRDFNPSPPVVPAQAPTVNVNQPAFSIAGFGVSLKTIIITGVALAAAGTILYRMATRGSRYVGVK